MINHVYLQFTLPALSLGSVFTPAQIAALPAGVSVAWTNAIGHALIREVSIEIGGQKIDKHYGTWLEIWDELTQVAEKQNGYNNDQKSSTQNTYRHCILENVKNSVIF